MSTRIYIYIYITHHGFISNATTQHTFGIDPPAQTSRQFCSALLLAEEEQEDNDGSVSVVISPGQNSSFLCTSLTSYLSVCLSV